jgi:hypothetical protein
LAGGLDSLECSIDEPAIRCRAAKGSSAPTLALYRVGSGFLGLATIGYRFSPAHTTFIAPPEAGAPPAISLIASSP